MKKSARKNSLASSIAKSIVAEVADSYGDLSFENNIKAKLALGLSLLHPCHSFPSNLNTFAAAQGEVQACLLSAVR